MLMRLGFQIITALTGILPRTWQYAIARRGADVYYLLGRNARESVKANLSGMLGKDATQSAVRNETRSVFRSFGMYLCEFFGAQHFGPKFIDDHVVVHGREHLDAALAKGRGVIFCSAHYSNWELGAMVVARLGYPITAVVQAHADPRTNEMFVQQRVAKGVTVIPTQHGAKGALRALRANQTVALMGDRTTGGPVVPVTMFGRRTNLPQGPWRIALTTGAALLPTFVHRRFDDQFTLEIGAPIQVPQEGDQAQRMQALAQAWTRCLEARLRTDPSQWAVFSRIWDEATPPDQAGKGGPGVSVVETGSGSAVE
ncbi:MAG TPA: lysophospholipid acyltransferase family protein [Planctomycetota bacterium]|nr:lysophospholipid acyltransferase family protein [Planctomycetota bacterium]